VATVKHKRGDTYTLNCTYTDADGVGIDLTSYTINSQARSNASATSTLFDVTSGSGITLTDATNGEYTLTVAASETESWTPGKYIQDIEYVTGGVVKSTETFKLEVEADVTR
jgi:hypothetical protein